MTYQTEFPSFNDGDVPLVPRGFVDHSRANESCPSFWWEEARVKLWVEPAAIEERSDAATPRFSLTHTDEHGRIVAAVAPILETDDWGDVLVWISQRDK